MLHLNARQKLLRPRPIRQKPMKPNPKLKLIQEPQPRLVFNSYYNCYTVYVPW